MRNTKPDEFFLKKIKATDAKDLASWKYKAPLDFYNHSDSPYFYLDPANNYSLLFKEKDILGFYCYGLECQIKGGNYKEEALDIGIGLNPKFIGKGLGKKFFQNVLNDIKAKKNPKKIRLSVANFNKAAIKIYESFGFKKLSTFSREDGITFSVFILLNQDAEKKL